MEKERARKREGSRKDGRWEHTEGKTPRGRQSVRKTQGGEDIERRDIGIEEI